MRESLNKTLPELSVSLEIMKQHRMSGLLQADLLQGPGIARPCVATLHLNEGELTICYLEDWQGKPVFISVEELCHFDEEEGPFEWLFLPFPTDTGRNRSFTDLPRSVTTDTVLQVINPLTESHLAGLVASQRSLIDTIFQLIEKGCSVEEINARVPLRSALVEETIQILVALQVVALH